MKHAVWLLMLSLTTASHADPMPLQLLARSQADVPALKLSEGDTQWLSAKQSLILGTSAPDNAPFDISSGSDYFEGLTADYAGLLAQALNLEIKVRRYDSRAQAIEALKNDQIDLLGTANAFESADDQLALSSAYALDTPVLVSRTGDSKGSMPLPPGLRMAMFYHYQPVAAVKAQYPDVQLELYASPLAALGAVAFGQAELYLGDAISAHYLITKNYPNNVYIRDVALLEEQSFSFAVHHPNPRLLRLINSALAAIAPAQSNAILQRWGVSTMSIERRGPLQLTPSEQRWIEAHPRLKVVVSEDFLPFTFFNDQGVFSGLAADLLAKISLRTGIQFDWVRSQSVPGLIEDVKLGRADLMPAFTASASREHVLRFTKPYISTPFVLVTRLLTGSPQTLDKLDGQRVALVIDNNVSTYLTQHYPGVQLIAARNSALALEMASRGEVQGAVINLVSARYLLQQHYARQLKISSTVGIVPAQFSLAVNAQATTLHAILDKALASISPEEMNTLTARWHSAVVLDNRFWARHHSAIMRVSAVAAGVLLLGIVWISYLRRVLRKRDQAERALSDQLAFMRTLIDGTPHPIYVRDRQGRLLICNEGYLDTFGAERESIVGKTLLEHSLTSMRQHKAYHSDYMRVMKEGRPLVRDHQLELPNTQVLTIYHWILPYRGSDNEVLGIIGGWIDISERQQLVEQLQEAKQLAEQANVAKSDFLTTMSHEIRTPMNAVIGMLELAMKKAEQGLADNDSLEVASQAAQGLLELIGDILDITQIESGRMSLNQQRTHLMKLVESTARVFEALAEKKGLLMSFELDPRINTEVLIDPLRFRQVLSNLLSNAIKFTDSGHVGLSVRAKGSRNSERLNVCVQIEDTGIGISEQDQQRLFSPFSQVSSKNKLPGGSGLGLMISRQLCEMMGGTLQLHSTLGKGTRISLEFDMVTLLAISPVIAPHEPPAPPQRALNVLVVDDYPPNRRLLTQQLGYLGHMAQEAGEGAQALKAWRAQRFDLIMTDCAMPVMDGYELARTIRAEEAANGTPAVLIVGFTANAQTGEVERCMAAGMNDCLFKPISLQHLEARLASADLEPINLQGTGEAMGSEREIDLDALERLTHGDADALKHLIEPLINSMEEDMTALLQAFTKHDLPGMSAVAHKVKSGARMIKARHLLQCCEDLEKACLLANWSQVAERVDDLYEAMAQILEMIEVYRV
ncbi:transporter substrate-binding domain-containing protein [Pseudomonas helleri]|jgi:two-component system, NarL family, sensor histidine kinase EvgS|nr:transporter substrate-binding domain-containing protein [Pseudomonas helleri]KMN16096.1 histidine kinase [Pseudomonas helleri]